MTDPNRVNTAVSWHNNQLTRLGHLPTTNASARALAINDNAQIVGVSGTLTNSRAVIWENGLVADLGTLGGATSYGFDINES